MTENGGNDAKIKGSQPQPSPFQGENIGKTSRRGFSDRDQSEFAE